MKSKSFAHGCRDPSMDRDDHLKGERTMWGWKQALRRCSGQAAVAVMAASLAGCAAIADRRPAQPAGGEARRTQDVALAGCLAAGAAPGTFVLTDVAGGQAVDVMSTRIGLTTYVGRRVAVR